MQTADAGEAPQDAGPVAPDAAPDVDAGSAHPDATAPMDADVPDTGVEEDAGTTTFPTLSDFRVCSIDTDCPVGLGRCVKTLAYDRVDSSGRMEVSVSAVDERVADGQGVCSETCTRDVTACETMSLKNTAGEDVPFTCQVMHLADSPYPASPPAFPFDDQVDVVEMGLGQPFAALCRPPFELDEDHIAGFCAACDENQGCDGGTCWRFDSQAPVGANETGVCLEPATQGCPIGFEVRALMQGSTDLGEHCVPLEETCGACVDRDGDLRGAGHCAEPVVDCDDRNPAAYFDASDMAHAFPAHCGVQDFNCNGLSDDAEQVGVQAYREDHCEACGDNWHGQTVNAGTVSEAVLECVAGQMQVASCADSSQVHCAGDPRQTGCESTAASGGQVYYHDWDADGFGDPSDSALSCPGGGAPSGFVTDNTDCDDTDPTISPAARDVCDCWGDCAQAGARVDNNCNGTFDEDVTGYAWTLDGDGDGAGDVAFDNNVYCGAPAAGTVISLAGEDCGDMDATTYGAHTRIADAAGAALALPVTAPPPRDASGNLFTVMVGAATEVCDGADNDCSNGVDDGVQTTYYWDQDADSYGDPNRTQLACAAPANYVTDNTDCDDGDGAVHPGAAEVCDGVDNDCVGGIDDTVPLGGACSTGLLGICDAGTETACVNGQYLCTQTNPAEQFDDPDPTTPSDEDCDGPENVVYVDPSGDNNNLGTAEAPRATLASAITLAGTSGATQIYMLAGNHTTSSAIFLADNLDVVGGFTRSGNVWSWGGGSSTIQHDGTPSGPTAIGLSAVNLSNVTLAYLNVQVLASPTLTGINHMGMYALNSNGLRLQNVSFDVASGTDGQDGLTGTAGAVGSPAGSRIGGRLVCDGLDVSGGNGAAAGSGASAGEGDGAGAEGHPADPDGIAASSVSTRAAGGEAARPSWAYGVTPAVAEAGEHGAGGGGGFAAFPFIGGGGGSGGCAGTGGTNGEAGGSSIGILSSGSEAMTTVAVTITVGGGGAGGDGGNGGGGGAAGTGAVATGGWGDGGDGRAGRGGGGGGSGYGGHAYPIYHQGTTDMCSASGISNVIRNITGTAGLGGAPGQGGRHGGSTSRANSGEAGHPGYSVHCFWSQPCFTTACGAGETCSGNYCVPDPT